MTFDETMALLDALNHRLRKVRPAWFAWEHLPNDWEHVILLARALDIKIPNTVIPALKSSLAIRLMIQQLRTRSEADQVGLHTFTQGQIDALKWVLE